MMNSLSEQKILKIDDTGNKFSEILRKYYEPHSFTTALLEVHDVTTQKKIHEVIYYKQFLMIL